MKTTLLHAFAAVLTLALASTPARAADVWNDNYETALATAKAAQKVIFVAMTGSDWSADSKKQAAKVFSDKAFQEYAAKNLVLLQLDFPKKTELSASVRQQNSDLRSKFSIRSIPTMLVLDPDGKELGRWVGYDGAGAERTIARIEACREKME